MGTKSPAAIGERISKDERHDLRAAARLSTRAFSPEQGGIGGPVQASPELVEHIGWRSTRTAEQLSPRIACTAVAAPSVRSLVFVFAGPSASMPRRGCRASFSRPASRWFVALISMFFLAFRVHFPHKLPSTLPSILVGSPPRLFQVIRMCLGESSH